MARKAKSTAPTAMEPTVVEVGAGPAPETVMVRSHRIACDGVGGALGHPRVWLEMGAAGFDTTTGFGLIHADAALNALHTLAITSGPTGTPNPVVPGGDATRASQRGWRRRTSPAA